MYHILIVDEEEHLLWALERNLFPERDDIEVHTAGSGEEGLKIMERESIDLLISDIKMPGQVDGFQLILRAKEMVPDARVMIITAFGTNRIQNFAERIGISHYIEKPFTVDELRHAVLEVLDEKEGFQGVLSDLELTDIIQMLCLAKRTALLHLKHRDHRGRIVFDAGEVVHAEFDGETGAEAVYIMLDLRQGDIFMQSDFEPVDRTINMGWQDLLLEGVKRTDEQRLKRQREEHERKKEEKAQQEEQASSEGADDDRPKRTMTPMGLGAAALGSEVSEGAGPADEEAQGGLEEESNSIFFSEAELEEISRASEAAMDGTPVEDEKIAEASAEKSDDQPQESSQPAQVPEVEESFDEASPLGFAAHLSEMEDGAAAEANDATEETARSQPARRRSSTSPGMTAVAAPVMTTEESGEYELFAAPALNGRQNDAVSLEAKASNDPMTVALGGFTRECPGLKATALVTTTTGEVLQAENLFYGDDLDMAQLGPRLTEVFGRGGRCVNALDEDDELMEFQLVLNGDYLLIRSVEGRPFIHVAIVDRQVSLGIALVLMRQLAKKLSLS